MTPAARLSQALQALGWSARALAKRLGCNPRLTQRWLAGERGYAPPEPLLVEIEHIADVVSQWRAMDWRRRSPQ